MSFRRILPALLLVGAPAIAAAQNTPAPKPKPAQLPADSMQLARQYTQWFYNNQIDSLMAHMDSAYRAQPGARSSAEQSLATLVTRAGEEQQVIEEKFITRNGSRQYWRTAKFSLMNEPLLLRWVINSKGQLAGAGLGPLSSAPPIDP